MGVGKLFRQLESARVTTVPQGGRLSVPKEPGSRHDRLPEGHPAVVGRYASVRQRRKPKPLQALTYQLQQNTVLKYPTCQCNPVRDLSAIGFAQRQNRIHQCIG